MFNVPNKPKPVTLRRLNPLVRKRSLAAFTNSEPDAELGLAALVKVKLQCTEHWYARSDSRLIVEPVTVHNDHEYVSGWPASQVIAFNNDGDAAIGKSWLLLQGEKSITLILVNYLTY